MVEPTPAKEFAIDALTKKIREILISTGIPPATLAKANPEDNLFEQGILDSISLIGLVLKIEEEFHIDLPDGDFDPWNFQSIGGIARLLSRRISK